MNARCGVCGKPVSGDTVEYRTMRPIPDGGGREREYVNTFHAACDVEWLRLLEESQSRHTVERESAVAALLASVVDSMRERAGDRFDVNSNGYGVHVRCVVCGMTASRWVNEFISEHECQMQEVA